MQDLNLYCVCICAAGLNHHHFHFTFCFDEALIFFTLMCTYNKNCSIGPSSPLDVKAIAKSSTSIEVTWKKPKVTNGVITNYKIYYKEKYGSDVPLDVTRQTYQKEITGLKKYTTYYVHVRGITTETGNASQVVAVTTLEDGTLKWIDLV